MQTPLLLIARRLKCTRCNERTAQRWHIEVATAKNMTMRKFVVARAARHGRR